MLLKAQNFFTTPHQSGRGEIRTHGELSSTTVFKTVPLNRSGTLPLFCGIKKYNKNNNSKTIFEQDKKQGHRSSLSILNFFKFLVFPSLTLATKQFGNFFRIGDYFLDDLFHSHRLRTFNQNQVPFSQNGF